MNNLLPFILLTVLFGAIMYGAKVLGDEKAKMEAQERLLAENNTPVVGVYKISSPRASMELIRGFYE